MQRDACFAEPQIVAAAKVPGKFFPVETPRVPIWLEAISDTAEAAVPNGDGLLVFIAAAPHLAKGKAWPPGSGTLFVTKEGCLVWHKFLPPDSVIELLDVIDERVGQVGLAQ